MMRHIARLETRLFFVCACSAAALVLTGACAQAREVSITTDIKGSPLTLSVQPEKYAGAIASITFRGVEYVDTHDHGRELQSALQLDNLGECYNPTEAGTEADGAGNTTTSTLLQVTNRANVLRTVTRAAFWLAPGQDYGRPCSSFRSERSAQNRTPLSDYRIARTTRFFGPANPNLIMIDVSFTFPEPRSSTMIEAMTGYLPPQFTKFYSYDPAAHQLNPLMVDTTARRSTIPVIVATADGRSAMGVVSPDIGTNAPGTGFYARFYFSGDGGTAKWSCMFSAKALIAGSVLHYECPIAIGTLDEVEAAMNRFDATRRR